MKLKRSMIAGLALACSCVGYSQDADLYDLSLEELMSMPVTSVSKRDQSLAQTAAAVHVITSDDIRRSPATSIPELLRAVPGVHVARIDANKWAITARGLNGRFANKLLVLQDGRSLYTPFFSGVYWDSVDLLLEDIERIEVIRGPGAAVWGANAVNGVINIITKDAHDTVGGFAKAQVSEWDSQVSIRKGVALSDELAVRGYLQALDHNALALPDGSRNEDAWQSVRLGSRLDWIIDADSDLTVSSEYFDTSGDERITSATLVEPFVRSVSSTFEASGAHVLARYRRAVSEASEVNFTSYIDYTDRVNFLYEEERFTIDLDYQQTYDQVWGANWLWGASFRRTQDEIMLDLVRTGITTDRPTRNDNLFGGFAQAQFELGNPNWQLTLGSKFEHNDYTGFEVQPNLRALWSPDVTRSVWASVARAVRTPARAESDVDTLFAGGVFPAGSPANPFPTTVGYGLLGSVQLEAEDLLAWEIGARQQIGSNIVIDMALFYNEYSDLREPVAVTPSCEPAGQSFLANPTCVLSSQYVFAGARLANGGEGVKRGVELSVDWQLGEVRLSGAYTYTTAAFSSVPEEQPLSEYTESVPRHLVSLRGTIPMPGSSELDLWLRHAGDITQPAPGAGGFLSTALEGYTSVDVQWRWQVSAELELALRAINLLDSNHIEFLSEAGDVASSQSERSIGARLRYSF